MMLPFSRAWRSSGSAMRSKPPFGIVYWLGKVRHRI
jgi:hypothetical protein